MAGFDTLDDLLSLAGFPTALADDSADTADLLQFAGFYRGLFDLEFVVVEEEPACIRFTVQALTRIATTVAPAARITTEIEPCP